MHRSGTSIITRMLEELGLFVGKKKGITNEALFFQHINDWILHQCGGAWDHPEPIRDLMENKKVRLLVVDYIRYLTRTPSVISYLGLSKYIQYGNPANMDIPWGWKDPRNTYTLPLWLEVFPDSKVLHIYRHGVDVANSLKVRHEELLSHAKALYSKHKLFYWLSPRRGEFTNTLRCASLEGGFSLWEEYLKEAQRHVSQLGNRAMEIKYENFLAKPCEILKSLARFCDLPINEAAIVKITGWLNKNRAYSYRNNSELIAFAGQVSKRLDIHGYAG